MKHAWLRHSTILLSVLVLALLAAGCPGPTPSPSSDSSPSPSTATPSGESGFTVRLTEQDGTEPEKPEMSASADNNHIRWSNETTVTRKIHFSVDWPFLETSGDISVAPAAKTAWYTLDPAKFTSGGRPFPYEVDPPLTPPVTGPEEPAISGQP